MPGGRHCLRCGWCDPPGEDRKRTVRWLPRPPPKMAGGIPGTGEETPPTRVPEPSRCDGGEGEPHRRSEATRVERGEHWSRGTRPGARVSAVDRVQARGTRPGLNARPGP